MTALGITAPGIHATIQDLGRFGAQHLGIPVSGAIDSINLRLANLLAGNEETSGAIELIGQGGTFEVLAASTRFAVAGPGAEIELLESAGGAKRLPRVFESFTLHRGDRFKVVLGQASSVCYLAVEGGFAVPRIMGSQSTFVRAALGGFKGRTLRKDDQIPIRRSEAPARREAVIPSIKFPEQLRFRIMLGPQDDYFDKEMIAAFLNASFQISHQSDRMGYRLSGFKLRHARDFNIVSDGIAPGAIQVPGSGEPIILLADRQTTGGYPKIGVVISADLPALGRLRPDDRISFAAVDFAGARKAALDLQLWFAQAKNSISEIAAEPSIDISALFEQNSDRWCRECQGTTCRMIWRMF